jgi:hypothetical protein
MEEVIEDAKAPLGARPILEEHANNNKFNKIALIVAAVRWSQASAKQRAEPRPNDTERPVNDDPPWGTETSQAHPTP